MPGLLGGVARTATAVSNRVSRRQRGRWDAQLAQEPEPQAVPDAQPAGGMDNKLDPLKQLGEPKAREYLPTPSSRSGSAGSSPD